MRATLAFNGLKEPYQDSKHFADDESAENNNSNEPSCKRKREGIASSSSLSDINPGNLDIQKTFCRRKVL